jgi:hypothetical protein
VGVASGRDPGADVEELVNPRLSGEVAERTPEERPVRAGTEGQIRSTLRYASTAARPAA